MDRAATLEQLARLCSTGRDNMRAPEIEASGSAALDAALPGGGWQVGSMVEMMPEATGIGELRLVMPALARITQGERHVALISPPFIPLAAGLSQQGLRLERVLIIRAEKPADMLWACEQTLRCKSFGAVIAWPAAIKDREVRRLQLAAEAGHSIGFLYLSPSAALEASPAATRLRLQSNQDGSLHVDILKCRGGRARFSVTVHHQLSAAAAPFQRDADRVGVATVPVESPAPILSGQLPATAAQGPYECGGAHGCARATSGQ